ncbi:MAG TPA: hypothetical protein EYG30_12815 [Planctomycetes bacterium]|nr:hypothetical protein [Planctomycetota bacterium]HIL53122.1 hypothetical protein [Planctomycetota bacterium]
MADSTQPRPGECGSSSEPGPTGVLSALPEELGSLAAEAVGRRQRQGTWLLELDLQGQPVLAVVAGVGKVRAARAATLLLEEGCSRILVVGTCGGLRRHLLPGTLVLCSRAVQADLSVRPGRESEPDPGLSEAWLAQAPGARKGCFLTSDRPVFSIFRRLRLARAFAGDCVADMETAAVAAVCASAGVPWAALRAVTDRAGFFGARSFQRHYPVQAGRAADTIWGLLRRLTPQ